MHKVLVAEPIYAGMHPHVYHNRTAFWMECGRCSGMYFARPFTMGPRKAIRIARDEAVDKTFETGATHLFFMDDDIMTPASILGILLDVDKPIVGGLMHKWDGTPIVYRATPDGEEQWFDHPILGAFECAGLGTGCMLIKAEVLSDMRRRLVDPYLFNYENTRRTMDVRFCRIAGALGWQTWCWPDIPCEQIKHY